MGPSGATDGGAAGGAAGDAAPLTLGGAAEGVGALGRAVAAAAEDDEAVGAALDGSVVVTAAAGGDGYGDQQDSDGGQAPNCHQGSLPNGVRRREGPVGHCAVPYPPAPGSTSLRACPPCPGSR